MCLQTVVQLKLCIELTWEAKAYLPIKTLGRFEAGQWIPITSLQQLNFGVENYGLDVPITHSPLVPAYTAPQGVYNTVRSMGLYPEINKNYNLSWTFPVDSGFLTILSVPKLAFLGKQDIWLELHPNIQTKPQYYDAILNGVEIFKVSNNDRKLAGINPSVNIESSMDRDELSFVSGSSKSSKKEKVIISTGSLLIVVLAISLCYLVAFRLKRKIGTPRKSTGSSLPYRSFSISEIRMATDNFDDAKLIDRGAFGLVYKGCIDRGTTAVIVNRMSKS
ncbi:hypothetical protein PTKIN_Ptkin17bG0143900 [Pterospermum kingtungense]